MKYWIAALLIFITWLPAQAAEFNWVDDSGTKHSLAEMEGKPVILHLWASWCPPCQSELPEFSSWLNAHPEINIIPVSLDENISDAASFLSSKGLDIPVLLSDSDQARRLGVRGLPTTLLIAADGSISQHHLGPRNWGDQTFTNQLSQ